MRDEIERIADVNERQRLLEQFDVFMARMARYGMLYESNPEHRTLWGLDIRVGDRVWQSHQAETEPLTVEGIDGDTFTAEGIEEPLPLRDYVRVALPGEPTFPILERIDSHNADAGIVHRLIEGDNLDALHLMTLNEASSYDVIYIDPPYGSGATEWSYNNRFVNPDNQYKNSMWLSMMSSRLAMARKLIRDDGVLIIAIDDFHMHNLRAMLDSDNNWRGWIQRVIVVRHHPQGGKDENYQKIHEYAIILSKRTDPHISLPRPEVNRNWIAFRRSGRGENNFRQNRGHAACAILVDPRTLQIQGAEPPHPRDEEQRARWEQQGKPHGDIVPLGGLNERQFSYADDYDDRRRFTAPVLRQLLIDEGIRPASFSNRSALVTQLRQINNTCIRIYPIDTRGEERCWRNPYDTITQRLIPNGELRCTTSNRGGEQRYTISLLSDSDSTRPRGIFGEYRSEIEQQEMHDGEEVPDEVPEYADVNRHPTRYSATTHGTGYLQAMFCEPKPFSYAKSLYTVYDLLEAACWRNPESRILDFFAGSGTTAHATMLLNSVHGGSRHCTLVTNAEMTREVSDDLWEQEIRPNDDAWLSNGNSRRYTFERFRLAIEGNDVEGNALEGDYSVFRPNAPDQTFPQSAGFPTQGVEFFSLGFVEGSSVRRGDWRWGEDHNLLASIHQVPPDRFRLINTPAEVGEVERNIAAGEVIEHVFVNSYDLDFYDLASNRFASQGIGVTSLDRYRTHFKTHPIPRHSGGIVR